MKKFAGIIVVAAVLFGAYQWRFGSWGWASPDGITGNTCEGRERCVSVYMAAWCPHCKSAVPTVQALLKKTKSGGKTGVRVVVGMGNQPGESERMAKGIAASGVILDDSTEIAQKLNVRGVPDFKVLDKDGTVLIDGPEARQWIAENL